MLENLHIRNLALVTELDMEFGSGLNTVTGETGAGKSLIIGAVQLLAGGRAAPSVIRKGEKSCEVAGVVVLGEGFQSLKQDLESKLEEAGIPPLEEGRLLLRRIVTESGSRAYVNGSMVTAGFLKDITESLIDLHGPHDNQTLLQPARQLSLLDTYAGLTEETEHLAALYQVLAGIRKEREEIRSHGLAPEEAGLLEFQLKEIQRAGLQPQEEEEILQKYRLVSNSRRLVDLMVSAQRALCGEEGSIAEQIALQLRSLRDLEELDPKGGADIMSQLETLGESVQEIGGQIEDYMANLELDQEEIDRIEKRLDLIQRLKRKYGPSLEDVIQTGERIRNRLDNIRSMSQRSQELVEKESAAQSSFLEACRIMSEKRQAAAPALGKAIQEKLRGLGFLRAEFRVSVKSVAPGPMGGDGVEFGFAANVGEDLQPVRNVASSGEVARVMLAVKTVLSEADSVPILIFDEIDANVGGRVAVSVAEELRAVGARHQVFSITHLPQIAAAGRQHYLVEKSVHDDRTSTCMRLLSPTERQAELVRMLGAEPGSEVALAHARELLQV